MEGQGANWACQPQPGTAPHDAPPRRRSADRAAADTPAPTRCSENEERAPTPGCHPAPGAQLSQPIAAQIVSPLRCPRAGHKLHSWVPRKKRGTELCVPSFSPNLSVSSITPPTLGHQDKQIQRPQGPGEPCTGGDRRPMGTPARAHSSTHGCVAVSVRLRVLWGSPWLHWKTCTEIFASRLCPSRV